MSRRLTLDDLWSIPVPTSTTIDPGGTTIVYALSRPDRDGDRTVSTLWRHDVGAERPPEPLCAGDADTEPGFGPDGAAIAFLRRSDGGTGLWVVPAGGGAERRLTDPETFADGVSTPEWSPDGKRIAFLAPVRVHREPAAPLVADRLGYKADGGGYLGEVRQQLFVVDVATTAVEQLTTTDRGVAAPAWSPDGTMIGYVTAVDDRSDLTGEQVVEVLDVDRPGYPGRRVGRARGIGGPLLWRPDSSAVIAVGSATVRVGHAGLIMLHLDPELDDRLLTARLDRNVMPGATGYPGGRPALTADGRSVLFCVRDRGWSHVYRLELDPSDAEPRIEPIVADDHQVVSALAVAGAAPRAVVAITTQQSFGEIALLDTDTGELRALTDHTAEALPEVELLSAEQRTFTVDDGSTVHGWLLRAPDHDGPGGLLLDIHGGPHNAWSGVADPVHLYHQVLAGHGWSVLTLNPRGSDGYGEDFFTSVSGSWGTVDTPDLMQPIDALIAEGIADPERLAVTGYSYGGFQTCQLTSLSDRFAAAVAGGLICDFADFPGGSDVGRYLHELELGDPATVGRDELAARSPISRLDRVSTPTLILHGGDDQRCPVNQAEQWFSGLRGREIPARLVIYPGGSHLFVIAGRPSHRLDYNARLVDWVRRYTSTATRPATSRPGPLGTAHWQRRLEQLTARHRVPGAQFGIVELSDDGSELGRTVTGAGVLNAATGVPVGDDAVFQIGSITKVWTTILIMQLVQEGKLDLDAPVRTVLPGLSLADEGVAAEVTTRHLVTHTSGIDGDLFTDTGRGDDAVEKYVASLADAVQVHPLGRGWSYCNSGFIVAGRIVEVLRGMTWDQALREMIIEPLRLDRCVTLPEEAILHPAAVGHRTTDDGPVPVATWGITRSAAPAGLITTSTGDLLTFAAAMLRGGVTADGTRILSAESAAAMATPQYRVTDVLPRTEAWGLGWFIENWHQGTVIGHDGGTIGQRAYLRLVPDQGCAVALLTNGGMSDGLYHELMGEAIESLTGLARQPLLIPPEPAPSVDPTAHVGDYTSGGTRAEITLRGERLVMRTVDLQQIAADQPEPPELELRPIAEGRYAVRRPDAATWGEVRFVTDGDGAEFLHTAFRRLPRVTNRS